MLVLALLSLSISGPLALQVAPSAQAKTATSGAGQDGHTALSQSGQVSAAGATGAPGISLPTPAASTTGQRPSVDLPSPFSGGLAALPMSGAGGDPPTVYFPAYNSYFEGIQEPNAIPGSVVEVQGSGFSGSTVSNVTVVAIKLGLEGKPEPDIFQASFTSTCDISSGGTFDCDLIAPEASVIDSCAGVLIDACLLTGPRVFMDFCSDTFSCSIPVPWVVQYGMNAYPSTAIAGQAVTLYGTGFAPFIGEDVISIDGTAVLGGSILGPLGGNGWGFACAPYNNGELNEVAPCIINAPIPPGSYTVTASISCGSGCSLGSLSTTLTVLAPSISVSPAEAAKGSIVTVSGSDFAASDTSVYITNPWPTFSCPVTGGSFSCTQALPSDVGPEAPIDVTGAQVGDTVSTIIYTPGPYPLTLSTSQATIGSEVTVTGHSFALTDTSVSLYLGDQPPPDSYNITPEGGCPLTAGSFTCTIVVPNESVLTGSQDVFAQGNNAGDYDFAELTVEPTVALSQASGPVGSIVEMTASGLGFNNVHFGLSFGGQTLTVLSCSPTSASCPGDSDLAQECYGNQGSFSCSFIVPDVPGGSYTVTATAIGDASETASATFDVTPSFAVSPSFSSAFPSTSEVILASPSAAPPGTLVTVTGFGFSSQDLELSFAGETTGENLYGDFPCGVVAGEFLCVFRVPAVPVGAYAIEALGLNAETFFPDGESASGAFMVTSPGATPEFPAGAAVTLTGLGYSSSDEYAQFNGGALGTQDGCPISDGRFLCSLTLPDSEGTFSITGQGGSYSSGESGTFEPVDQSSVATPLSPSLSITPAYVEAGATVTVAGSGYSSSDGTVALYLGASPVATCTVIGSSISDCDFVVPTGASPGYYTVRATGDAGGTSDVGSAGLGVIAVTVLPTSGPPGTKIQVAGSGFSPLDTSASGTVGSEGVSLQSDVGLGCPIVFGLLDCSFSSPSVSAGSYQVTVTGDTGDQAAAPLTITVPPTISLSESTGPTGTQVTVTGENFGLSDNEAVLYFAEVDVTSSSGCYVAIGSISCSFSVPGQYEEEGSPPAFQIPPGTYTIFVNANSGDSAQAEFTVTTSLSLSAIQGPVGTVLAVTGTGYSDSSSSLALTMAGESVGPPSGCQLSAGSIVEPCDITVPSVLLGGTYYVQASDGNGGTASDGFLVTPSITLSPSTGSAYATVTVTGSGFGTAGEGFDTSVVLSFAPTNGEGGPYLPDAESVGPAAGCTASGGTFSCTFEVPSDAEGPYEGEILPPYYVTATGNTGDSTSAAFTTANLLEVEPITQGPTGTELTVRGSGYSADTYVALTFGGQTVTPASGCPVFFGSFVCSFDVPNVAYGQTYAVTAVGNSGDVAEGNEYTVTSTNSEGYAIPSMTYSAVQGPVGTTVTMSGSGFGSSTSIFEVGLSNYASTVAGYLQIDGCTISGGSIVQPCSVVIPSSITCSSGCLKGPVTQGAWFLDAYSDSAVAYGYFVVTPSISLSASSGRPGTTVTVSGSDFSSDTEVQVWLGGQDVGPAAGCPVSSGSISSSSCSFVVPSTLAGGGYTVYAIGANDLGPATAPFSLLTQSHTTTASSVYDSSSEVAWSGTEVTGASAYDTSSVTGVSGTTPSGTVAYTFFDDGTCSGTGSSQQVNLAGDGSVPPSQATPPLAPGSYSYTASYSGDSNYFASNSGCEPFSVAPAPSTTTSAVYDSSASSPWSGGETAGASAYDTSTVTGLPGFVPTGSVTYELFDGSGCSGTPSSSETANLGSGTAPVSPATGPLAAGPYSFEASYSGDSDYRPSSECEPFSVAKASPTISTEVTPAAVDYGLSAADTATLYGGYDPTGTVTYAVFSDSACTTAVGSYTSELSVTGNGQQPSSAAFTAPAVGTYYWQVTYSGDSNNKGVSLCGGPSESLTVDPRTTSLSVTCPATAVDEAADCTASVSDTDAGIAITPAGTVGSFSDSGGGGTFGSTSCTLSAGACTFTYTPAPGKAGSEISISATYSGDPVHQGSSGSTTLTPAERTTSTALACVPSTGQIGSSVTCTATVADNNPGTLETPGGSVGLSSSPSTTLLDLPPSCTLGPTSTAGVATCSVTFDPATGSQAGYTITAAYPGDADHSGSSGDGPLIVEQPGTVSQASTGTTLSGGGASANQESTTGATVTITGSSAPSGTSVTITSEELSAPSSNVGVSGLLGTKYYDVSVLGISDGTAQVCITSTTPVHTLEYWNGHSWVKASGITVTGDTICGYIPVAALQGTNLVTGNPRTDSTTLSCLPVFEVLGYSTPAVTCTASVTDTSSSPVVPTGAVTFSITSPSPPPSALNFPPSPCNLLPVQGSPSTAECSLAPFTPGPGSQGQYTFQASYAGDLVQAGGSATYQLSVDTPLEGTQQLIDVVNGMGLLRFVTEVLDVPLDSAAYFLQHQDSRDAAGQLEAFLATVNFESQAPFAQIPETDAQVLTSYGQALVDALTAPTTTTVSCSTTTGPFPPFGPQDAFVLTCTATVAGSGSPGPTGLVSWTSTSPSGSFQPEFCVLGRGGSCSVEYKDTSAGTTTITAQYSGDQAFAPSSGSTTVTIPKSATTATVSCGVRSARAGSPVTCTVTVDGVNPTGTVSFTTSSSTGKFSSSSCTLSYPRGPGEAQCQVTYTDSSTGKVTITATYSGDQNNQPSSGSTTVDIT